MKETADRHILWNEAAKAGLALGIFTGLFVFASMLLSNLGTGPGAGAGTRILASLVSIALWLLKFIGCLWLLRFTMLRFASRYDGITSKKLFRFGMLTALTSAIIVAGLNLLCTTALFPDVMQQAIDSSMQSYSAIMPLGDSDRVAMERMMSHIPQISFFVTLIYCFLYGTVASKIFSSSIQQRDSFGDPVDRNDGEND